MKAPYTLKNQCFSFLAIATFVFSAQLFAAPYAFITNQLDNTVSVIDAQTHKVIKTIPVTGKPVGVAVNDKMDRVYISTPNGGGLPF